jgi:hypothetical protein
MKSHDDRRGCIRIETDGGHDYQVGALNAVDGERSRRHACCDRQAAARSSSAGRRRWGRRISRRIRQVHRILQARNRAAGCAKGGGPRRERDRILPCGSSAAHGCDRHLRRTAIDIEDQPVVRVGSNARARHGQYIPRVCLQRYRAAACKQTAGSIRADVRVDGDLHMIEGGRMHVADINRDAVERASCGASSDL